jgi:hypothetical protein
MSTLHINRDKTTITTYVAICQTFLDGVVRLIEAQAAFGSVMHTLTTYRSQKGKLKSDDEVLTEILAMFDNISLEQFWSAQYVNMISSLVYAASLFDTFLNESTIFLFLLIPDAIGKTYQVPLRSLVDAQSTRGSILTEVAKQRAREISFKSFKDRLSFLRDTFGLPIALTGKTLQTLDHFTNLRNSAVHDQGFLALSLETSGCIKHGVRASPKFPSNILPKDSDKAERTFRFIALTVADDIFKHILKAETGALPRHLGQFIEKMLASSPPEL